VQGRILAKRWRLLSELGKGGMGSVWRAEHVELSTPAAVKLIDPMIADSDEALSRFKREAQAAATLRSPHVVQILDYGVDQGTPYIAMELLEGETLAARLRRVGRLPPEATANILTYVARAVGKAHDIGVIHRDLKPDNIFLVPYEDEELAKVLDFGIAKRKGTGSLGGPETRTGSLLGTPFYMSPEQASGRKEVDHRTDIWAMAVIAFECLTGRRPFVDEMLGGLVLAICTEAPPVPSSVAPVPAGFDQWFARGTAKDAGQRFQSVKEQTSELCVVCGLGHRRDSMPSAPPARALAGGTARLEGGPGYRTGSAAVTPPKSLQAGASGGSGLGSTSTQAPPSSVSVSSFVSRSRIGLLLVVAGVVVLVAGAIAAFTVRSSPGDTSSAASAPAMDPPAYPAWSVVEQSDDVVVTPVASASSSKEQEVLVQPKETEVARAASSAPAPKRIATPAVPHRAPPAAVKDVGAATPARSAPVAPRRDPRERLNTDLGL